MGKSQEVSSTWHTIVRRQSRAKAKTTPVRWLRIMASVSDHPLSQPAIGTRGAENKASNQIVLALTTQSLTEVTGPKQSQQVHADVELATESFMWLGIRAAAE
jgi:hypothetical protein